MNLKQLKDLLRELKKQISEKVSENDSLFDKVKDRYKSWDKDYTKFLSIEAADENIELSEKSKEYKDYEVLRKEAEKLIKKLTPKLKPDFTGGSKKGFNVFRRNTIAAATSSTTPPASPRKLPVAQSMAALPAVKFTFALVDDFNKLFAVAPNKARQLTLQLVDPKNIFWGVSALNKVKIGTEKIAEVLIKNLREDELVKVFAELFKLKDISFDEGSLLQLMVQNFHTHGCCKKFKESVYEALTTFGDLAAKMVIVDLAELQPGSRSSIATMQPAPGETNKRDSMGLEKPLDIAQLQTAFASMAEAIFLSKDMPKSLLEILVAAGDKQFAVLAKIIHATVVEHGKTLSAKYDRQSLLRVMLSTIPTLIVPAQSQMDSNDVVRKDLIGDRDKFKEALCVKIQVKLNSLAVSSPIVSTNQAPPTDIVAAINQLLGHKSFGFGRAHSRSAATTTFMGGSAVPKEVVDEAAKKAKSKDKVVGDGSQSSSSNSNWPPSNTNN